MLMSRNGRATWEKARAAYRTNGRSTKRPKNLSVPVEGKANRKIGKVLCNFQAVQMPGNKDGMDIHVKVDMRPVIDDTNC
jgi:hypothetical protein